VRATADGRAAKQSGRLGAELTRHRERQTDGQSNGSNAQKRQGNLQIATLGMSSRAEALFVTMKAFGFTVFITIS
jgi:hypothetical protein